MVVIIWRSTCQRENWRVWPVRGAAQKGGRESERNIENANINYWIDSCSHLSRVMIGCRLISGKTCVERYLHSFLECAFSTI